MKKKIIGVGETNEVAAGEMTNEVGVDEMTNDE
jgi:hypothetical protein